MDQHDNIVTMSGYLGRPVTPMATPAAVLITEEVKITPVPTYAGCGDNQYKAYIYSKESGCKTDSVNKDSGACGLGQAYPCKKLPCSLQDYECQDAWFSNYAMSRYGSWQAAYEHKIATGWW